MNTNQLIPPVAEQLPLGTRVFVIGPDSQTAIRFVGGYVTDDASRPLLSPSPDTRAFVHTGPVWLKRAGALECLLLAQRSRIAAEQAKADDLERQILECAD